MVGMQGRFADAEIERAFSLAERRSKIQIVRLYGVLTFAVLLAYALINPLFFSLRDEIRFTILLLPALIVLGGYVGLTFWSGMWNGRWSTLPACSLSVCWCSPIT